jgi:hypothetical protein
MSHLHKASLEEMWKVIEDFGIKREEAEIAYPTEEQVSKLYGIIKNRNHEQINQETIRQLREYTEEQ